MSLKNIIFDLGGVLLDIDYDKTVEAFRSLGIPDPDQAFSKAHQARVFRAYEKGEITSASFLNHLMKAVPACTESDLTHAWCALLGPMREEKFRLLETLSKSHRLFILSNTNNIHQKVFEAHIEGVYGMEKFRSLFEKIHYSHELGMRKPDTEIFETVLDIHKLAPKETLFIDDTEMHVDGARKTGLIAAHLSDGETLEEILKFAGVMFADGH
ncbi:MAG: HAD family hydrolase [Cryomorphaceae bacterium]|nr:HAD family phosphatase [Flavobacteriales bacterium]